ncbi:hypothetical protein K1T71_015162 [Dendrolimus kikuchii]|nr:hypothetical protein K1T71_015162 [Dendrolimus kikuchii]
MQGLKKIIDLHKLISKMPQDMCLVAVLPEFGPSWRDVSKVLYKNRLQMTPENLAWVLCTEVSAKMTLEEVDEIISKLQLKLVAIQDRTWHVFKLLQSYSDEPVSEIINNLSDRIENVLMGKLKNKVPVLETLMLDDLVYISVQISNTTTSKGMVQYFVTCPGEPVLLSCSTTANAALKACVEALGYRSYEYAMLYGCDIHSLLRISSDVWTTEANNLATPLTYNPTPLITKNGIDYTNKDYNINYVDNILGPNPPLLTELNINSSKMFYDRDILNKPFNLKVNIKTSNLAETLKSWAVKEAIEPTSELLSIFHKCKSNCIEYSRDSD